MPLILASAAVAVGFVFSQVANCAASCWCLDAAITPVEEPPQLPATLCPADHCGSAVMTHLPALLADTVGKSIGAQTSYTQPMYWPSFIPLSHAAVHCGWLFTAPVAMACCQKEKTFCEAASSMPTCQVDPEADHHWAPACCARPANSPGSWEENVLRYTPGASACSFVASARNWAQVVGTVSLYLANRAGR